MTIGFSLYARAAVIALVCANAATLKGQQTTSAASEASCNPQESAFMKSRLLDWAGLKRYKQEDAALPTQAQPGQRVVFLGDSITDFWGRLPDTGSFFPGKHYINRGIGGQTTPQILARFEQDVVHLHPAAVVILAGTNDIAGNTGPSTPQIIEDNYTAMTEIAAANGIKVILASITPADHYNWQPTVHPVDEIRELNGWMRQFCSAAGCTYLDYYTAMSDPKGAMLPGYSKDGVHPTSMGYGIMAPLAEKAIAKALQP